MTTSLTKVTVAEIVEQLHRLEPEQLTSVYDYVCYLADRQPAPRSDYDRMMADAAALRRVWQEPGEDDEPWRDYL